MNTLQFVAARLRGSAGRLRAAVDPGVRGMAAVTTEDRIAAALDDLADDIDAGSAAAQLADVPGLEA